MDLPEPPDPSGLWEEVKALANPWPQDSETQAYALADALDAAAGVIERANLDVQAIARQVPGVWIDEAGFAFAETLRVLDADHLPLVLALRQLALGAREYGQVIRETKISIWLEIGANAAMFVALLPIPGASSLVAARVAGRLATLVAERAGQVAASGPLQAAKHAAVQSVLGAGSEIGNEAATQLISMATGTRDRLDVKDVVIAGVAGAGGEVLGDALRRVATGAIIDTVQRGLERVGMPSPVASHPAIAAEAVVNNGLTSTTTGYAAEKAVNGEWAALADVDGYVGAVRDGGLSAGVMGAGAANSLHLGMQLHQLGAAPSTGPAVGTGSTTLPADGNPPSPQTAAPPSNQVAGPPPPHQAATPPPSNQPVTTPSNHAVTPPPHQGVTPPPHQGVIPPSNQGVTPPLSDGGSVEQDPGRQEQGAPPATSTAPATNAPDAGIRSSMPSDAGPTGSGASAPVRSETAAGPTVTPYQPSGVEATAPHSGTATPSSASGATAASGAADALGAGDGPMGTASDGGTPLTGPAAANPAGPIAAPIAHTAAHPTGLGGAPAAGGPPAGHSPVVPAGPGAGTAAPVGTAASATAGPAITGPGPAAGIAPSTAAGPTGPTAIGSSTPTGPATTSTAAAPANPAPANPSAAGAPTVVPAGPATSPTDPQRGSGTGRGRHGTAASSPDPDRGGDDRQGELFAETASAGSTEPTTVGMPAGPGSAAVRALASGAPAARPGADPPAPRTPPTHTRVAGPPGPTGRAADPDTAIPATVDATAPRPGHPNPPEPEPEGSEPDRAAFNLALDDVLPRLDNWFASLRREGDALVAVTTDGRHARSVPPVLDPGNHPSVEAYQRAVARAVLHELSTAAVRPATPGARVVRAAPITGGSGTAPASPDPRRIAGPGAEGPGRGNGFAELADEHARLGDALDAELARHGLRRDPDSDLVRGATLDGQDPRGVLAGALAARAFGGADLRTELGRRLPGAWFTPLRDGLADLPPDRARQVLATEVRAVLDTLARTAPGATAYLLVTDAAGAQRGYALLDRPQDGQRIVLGYDPQTGREAPLTDGAADAVPIGQFLAALSPARAEVLVLDARPMSWDDPRVPDAARALRAGRQAAEAAGRLGVRPATSTEGHRADRPRTALSRRRASRHLVTSAHSGSHVDNSHTATTLPGAPAHAGPVDPEGVFGELLRALRAHGSPVTDATSFAAVLRLPGRPPLRFRVGTPPEGQRSHRTDVVIDGETFTEVVVSADPPAGPTRGRWVDRVVGHELDEDAALRNEGFVARAKAKLRSSAGGPAHPDALRRGADPSLAELSPHDVGHRTELRFLVAELRAAPAESVDDIEVELGLLLDHLGIGRPHPDDPDAEYSDRRLAMLGLTDDELAAVHPLLPDYAGWRSMGRRVAHMERTGEVGSIEAGDGTTVTVRFSRRPDQDGTGFTVRPPEPLPGPDGVPARDPDGQVRMAPAEVIFDRQADVRELARDVVERLRTEVEPPTFVPWMSRVLSSPESRVNTSADSIRLARAYHSARTAIEDGLAAVDGHRLFLRQPAWPIGPPWHGEGHVVWVDRSRQERPADEGPLAVELRFGPLPAGQAYRVDPVADPGPGRTRQVRVVVADVVRPDHLTATVAEAVVRAVETVMHGDDAGVRAAAELAQRMGDRNLVVGNLARAGLLSDQPGSRKRVKELRNWLAGMADPTIPLRMFDTGAVRGGDATLQSLRWALDTAAESFTPDAVAGAGIHDLRHRVATVRVDDARYQVPIKVTRPNRRGYAVRLEPDPNAPHGYRLLVRSDASEAAILVETAGALAQFGTLAPAANSGQTVDEAAKRVARKAARDARVEVLTSLYRVATRAERIMIDRYVEATVPRRLHAAIHLRLSEVAGRRGIKIDGPLVARVGRKPYWPAMLRRLVSSVGSGGNSMVVGEEFGRDPSGIMTSVVSGVASSIFQADADSRLGSALPTVRLVADTDKSLVKEAGNPPGRERGDPITKNVKKRTPAALAGTTATAAIQSRNGDVEKTVGGSSITLLASLLQAVADKAADPREFDAVRKRDALEKQEPDTVRNLGAKNVYHRVRKLYDENPTLDRQLEHELRAALTHLEQAIQESVDEVSDKLAALARRRSVVVQPARHLWNRTGGRVSDSWRFQSPPGMTYELVHLPKARAALPVNPLRVGSQHALMQVASLYLGFATTPQLLTANMLMQAGRGLGYGAGWTPLSAWEAGDKTAAASARALYQLRESKQMIDELLSGDRHPENHLGVPSGRLAIVKQVIQDRSATVLEGENGRVGIPQEQSGRSQSVKHVTGFVGGVAAATPLLWAGIPIGDELVWLVGQVGYTALYALGEGVMRVATPIIKQIDAETQLQAEAARLPFTPLEVAQDVTRMARQAAEATEEITSMPVPDDTPTASLGSRFARGTVRAGLGGARLFAAGTALRPGDNPPGPLLLNRQDAVQVNLLVEHARYLDRVAAAEQDDQRVPVGLNPVMLRGYLRHGMEDLGLLVEQAGSAARWEAVVRDARLRFGLDLDAETELGTLRADPEGWGTDESWDRVREWLDRQHDGDKVGYGVTRALDVMTRKGWFSSDPGTPGGPRQLRLAPEDTVRVGTEHGRFELRVRSRQNGPDGGLAVLEPQPDGPHGLYVDPEVIADPDRLAVVLHGAVNTWLVDRFRGAAALVIHDPGERIPAP
ncbi:hypothetical protein ACFP2T_39280 [Plantactinospora solaniradicis]|uniref:Outer membrane channel protein CpnT-like N-terminal domain-containing protein n=1 Tax=Plantactinospora solaniradicis TaxID=1723736 RepID=A0ABW1KMW4_9ACTN